MDKTQMPDKPQVSEEIKRRKLCDEVADRLLKSIQAGEFGTGGQLPSERELVARYGVGRPSVREALQTLQRMGVITITHGEPARLIGMDPRAFFALIDGPARHLLNTSHQTLEHLSEARLFFEVGMVRLAVQRGTEEDVLRLEGCLDRLRLSAGDRKRFVAADMAFHTAIASFANNPLYTALSEFMLRWLFENYPDTLQAPGVEQLTIAEHERIYRHIADKDAEEAARAMTEHLTRSNPRYAEYLSPRRAKRRREA